MRWTRRFSSIPLRAERPGGSPKWRDASNDETPRDAVQAEPKDAVRLVYDPLFEKALSPVVGDNWGFFRKVKNNADLHAKPRAAPLEAVYRKLTRFCDG